MNEHFLKGLIVSLNAPIYFVQVKDKVFKCKSRGKSFLSNIAPTLGDWVMVNKVDQESFMIEEVLPRTNLLYRPKIANIDQVIFFTSVIEPAFNSLLLNKCLTLFSFYELKSFIVITKSDLLKANMQELLEQINAYPPIGIEVLFISNTTQAGMNDLKALFPDKVSLITGSSGVGKSTTINSLNPDLNLKTQEISAALGRGKNTTTNSKLYQFEGGWIADTPGYSSFDLQELTQMDIAHNFPGFKNYLNKCKYRSCLHISEPDCAIKIAVETKNILDFLYRDYCKIIKEKAFK